MVTNSFGRGFTRPGMANPNIIQPNKPALVQPSTATRSPEEKFTFFWQGPLSQWHMCKFTVHHVEYNCTEQWMMAEKARLFNDRDTESLILKAKSPKEQKALGRQVKGFNEDVWNQHDMDIVENGNYAKFTQNMQLLKILLAGEGTTFVEASPYDKIWGIGLAANDPRATVRSQWKGQNKLGIVLTRLCDKLVLTHKDALAEWEDRQERNRELDEQFGLRP